MHSPAEKRRVLFFHFTERETGADTGTDSAPKPARDVAPGQCWAFLDHRTKRSAAR
jgi:hypothetical protein